MTWCAYLALPLSLEGAGAVLGLNQQKMKEGKDLIRYFCKPCSPTRTNRGRTRNMPWDAPEKWSLFESYNKRDVEVELSIKERLKNYPVPDFVWEEYHLSEHINDRGILIDKTLVENAIRFNELSKAELSEQMKQITALENPNSVQQLRGWLAENGLETESLGKKDVAELMKTAPAQLQEVLSLRLLLSKSSIKKYEAMANSMWSDGRCRGMFMFYGAARTGRFAGRIIQLQNLVRNSMPDLNQARELVKHGDYDSMAMLYDVPDALSQLIRTAFIPKPGYKFYVADYSAIEARVIAYIAGESWRLEAFKEGKDIYCASASAMFGVPVEKHGINGDLRQKGKIAELANGYGGSVGALKAMGALDMGLTEDELKPLVDSWRAANPNIVRLWYAIEQAAMGALRQHTTTETHGLKFICRSGMLFIELPSGRQLAYVKPQIGTNRFGSDSITYEGTGTARKWERLETFGGKLTENIVQAISRDILCNAMRNLEGCYIVGHIHDELIIECPEGTSLEEICNRMATPPDWMKDILLRADGYIADYYMKD